MGAGNGPDEKEKTPIQIRKEDELVSSFFEFLANRKRRFHLLGPEAGNYYAMYRVGT